MGKYGNGLSFAKVCSYDKQHIKKAFENKICVGEDDNGEWIYEDCTPEEAHRVILDAYDNVVFHAMQLAANGRAVEKWMKKNQINMPFDKYYTFMEQEMENDRKNKDYEFEPFVYD